MSLAEYERAKILERSRRGKQHAARRGSVNVLSGAPYGYRYISKRDGDGEARYQVVAEEARVVRRIFEWVGQERCSIGEVCRRLKARGGPHADREAGLGPLGGLGDPQEPRLQGDGGVRQDARRGRSSRSGSGPSGAARSIPRRPVSRVDTAPEDQIFIAVPGLVERGPLRGGPGAARREPATPSRPARRRPLPAPGADRLQAVRLRLLRQAGEPGLRPRGRVPYAYYRCTGSDAYRFGGQRLCWNKQVRTDLLDAAVWEDVRHLLSEPERVRAEYERRLAGAEAGPGQEVEQLTKMIKQCEKERFLD